MSDFLKLSNTGTSNLSQGERSAIIQIKNWDDVVIKPSDKGGNVVIWPKILYVAEALKQLTDGKCYSKLHHDPTSAFRESYNSIVQDGYHTGLLTKPEFKALNNIHSRTPTFYMLPKIHKNITKPPGRPIVSGNGNLCEQASIYIDKKLRPFVCRLPSYTRDTSDLLSKIENVKVPSGTILVTCDVESLYTCILHKFGLMAIRFFLETESDWDPQYIDFIVSITQFCLTHNFFIFNNKFYLQQRGVAMGAAFAPTYANLFLGWWEANWVFNDELTHYTQFVLDWFRYIDDLFFLWTGTTELLEDFLHKLNENGLNIKLTHTYSTHKIDFLDISIYIMTDGVLTTDLYRKPTATNSILHFQSHHLKSTKKAIPYGEFIRLRHNCSDHTVFVKRAKELMARFKDRGYSGRMIKQAYHRACGLKRTNLLLTGQKKTQSSDECIRFVSTFNNQWPSITAILKKHWHVLLTDITLRKYLGEFPSTCCRRSPNLRDKLVSSHFQSSSGTSNTKLKGTYTCGHCKACKYIYNLNSVVDRFNIKHEVRDFFNCRSESIIYLITCPCGKQYVGKTIRMLKDRLLEHIRNIEQSNIDASNNTKMTPIARHFHERHEGKSVGLKMSGLSKISLGLRGGDLDRALIKKESEWIFLLNSLSPKGLNRSITLNAFL
uniref:GIY-YIG domain-containing protein n=1 Tax=Xenopus tropicalis TaxID=8364 RepID=A0A803JIM5_XENTR